MCFRSSLTFAPIIRDVGTDPAAPAGHPVPLSISIDALPIRVDASYANDSAGFPDVHNAAVGRGTGTAVAGGETWVEAAAFIGESEEWEGQKEDWKLHFGVMG